MARYINADKFLDKLLYMGYMDEQKSEVEEVANNMIEEAIPKADYEARLKADMAAMLTEIQLEIEEKEQYYQDKFLNSKNAVHDAAMGGRMFGCGECKEVIQQKINELKADQEWKE